ncbi:GNAT family N-acetyltransferase [Nocardioides sp. MH1]|uniref:GNAT family N-acetyltransferase n=1 Tax=Nocardioides sp. MH1 TaxID=3242490 RepID=UPI00351FC065
MTDGGPTSTVETAQVLLRPFEWADVAARSMLGQDASIVRMFGGSPTWEGRRSLPIKAAEAWYDAVSGEDNPHSWAVEVDGRFVGTARLHGLVEHDRRAHYAVGILDPALLGQGIGRKVTRIVLDHAFGKLDLHRVDLRVLAFNTRAIRCYQACGFVEEGRERQAALVDGEWHDDVIMGILASEHRA